MIEEEIIGMLLSGVKLVITHKTLSLACSYKRGKAILHVCLKSEKLKGLKLKVYF